MKLNPVKLIEPTYQSSPIEAKWSAVIVATLTFVLAIAQYLEWDMALVAIITTYAGALAKPLLGLSLPNPPAAATEPSITPSWLRPPLPAEPLTDEDEALLERFRESMRTSPPLVPPEPRLPVVDHENLTSRPEGL